MPEERVKQKEEDPMRFVFWCYQFLISTISAGLVVVNFAVDAVGYVCPSGSSEGGGDGARQ